MASIKYRVQIYLDGGAVIDLWFRSFTITPGGSQGYYKSITYTPLADEPKLLTIDPSKIIAVVQVAAVEEK